MARKHTLGIFGAEKLAAVNSDVQTTSEGQAPPPSPAYRRSGALGSVASSLRSLSQKADEAANLERQLQEGVIIVELSPQAIDPSFVTDRMIGDDDNFQALKSAISEKGQLAPILVRPHPEQQGRFQTAFGHRRLRACKELNISVRAIVKNLTDEELVVAQGQENASRADLSFIEKSLFASRLLAEGYNRGIIMSALSVDKTQLSKMLAVVHAFPEDLLRWLGPCAEIGRPRWIDLADKWKSAQLDQTWRTKIDVENSVKKTDFEKFRIVSDLTKSKAIETETNKTAASSVWVSEDQAQTIEITTKGKNANLRIVSEDAGSFANYILSVAPSLYKKYKAGS